MWTLIFIIVVTGLVMLMYYDAPKSYLRAAALFFMMAVVIVATYSQGRIHGHKEAKEYIETGKLPNYSPVKAVWLYEAEV